MADSVQGEKIRDLQTRRPEHRLEKCFPLSEVSTVYEKSIKNAKKLWNRFSAYVSKKEGITLSEATLWLTPCETA